MEEQNRRIIQLYKHRVKYDKISQELNLPVTTIRGRIHHLIDEGKIISIRSRNIKRLKEAREKGQAEPSKKSKKIEEYTNEEIYRAIKRCISIGNIERAEMLLDYYTESRELSEKQKETAEKIKTIIQRSTDKSKKNEEKSSQDMMAR